MSAIEALLFEASRFDDPLWASSTFALLQVKRYNDAENGLDQLKTKLEATVDGTKSMQRYINILHAITPQLPVRQLPIDINLFNDSTELHQKAIGLQCLIANYFKSDINEIGDQKIVNESLKLIEQLYARTKNDKEYLLYNEYVKRFKFYTKSTIN